VLHAGRASSPRATEGRRCQGAQRRGDLQREHIEEIEPDHGLRDRAGSVASKLRPARSHPSGTPSCLGPIPGGASGRGGINDFPLAAPGLWPARGTSRRLDPAHVCDLASHGQVILFQALLPSLLTPCLQNACGSRHTVADLASLDLQGRPEGRAVGGRCGHDCGQRCRPGTRRARTSSIRSAKAGRVRAFGRWSCLLARTSANHEPWQTSRYTQHR
jgi:hypothetical protein